MQTIVGSAICHISAERTLTLRKRSMLQNTKICVVFQIRNLMCGAGFVQLISTDLQRSERSTSAWKPVFHTDQSHPSFQPLWSWCPSCDTRSHPRAVIGSATHHLASCLRLSTQGFLQLYISTAQASHMLPPRSPEHQRFRPMPKHGQLVKEALFDSTTPSISTLLPES